VVPEEHPVLLTEAPLNLRPIVRRWLKSCLRHSMFLQCMLLSKQSSHSMPVEEQLVKTPCDLLVPSNPCSFCRFLTR
jgi:hypothetical protein